MSHFGFNPQNRPFYSPPMANPATGIPNAVANSSPSGGLPGGMPNQLQQGFLIGKMLLEQLSMVDSSLTNRDMQQMLKQVLRLPPDIQSLLELLAEPESPNTTKASISPESAVANSLQGLNKVPLTALQKMMEKRLEQANTRFIELMQGNPAGHSMDGQKFGELMGLASQLLGSAGQSPVNALQITFLLYLPWNPMPTPEQLAISFEPSDEESGAPNEEPTLVILLHTKALGRFKLSVNQADGTRLVVEIEHDSLDQALLKRIETSFSKRIEEQGFPAPHLTFIERQTRITSNKPILPPNTDAYRQTSTVAQDSVSSSELSESFNEVTSDTTTPPSSSEQNIAVYPAEGVSLFVVMGGYQLARIIFELDSKQELIQQRQQSI